MVAVGPIGGPLQIRKAIVAQGGGINAVMNLDGTWMSVNPDGTEKTATDVGPWEKCTRDGDILTFWVGPTPGWHGTHANVFQIVETLPNDNG